MDLRSSRILSVCSGVGQLDTGIRVALPASRVVCCVEHEAYAAHVLASRMEDKALDEAPIWTNLRTFDGRQWRGLVDGIVGGYPCQPFSQAGRRLGTGDPRHLWPEILRLFGEIGPRWGFFENVRGHISRGFDVVYGDLRAAGYRVKAGIFSAEEVGASHRRERLFILAYRPESQRQGRPVFVGDKEWRRNGSRRTSEAVADAQNQRTEGGHRERTATPRGGEPRPKRHGLAVANAELCPGVETAWVEPDRVVSVPRGKGGAVAISCGKGLSNTELRGVGAQEILREEGEVRPSAAEFRGTFAPGPGDLRKWGGVISDGSGSYLAPATQPGVRVLVNGMALVVDESRADQLRAIGNGVVPLQAAYAFSVLTRQMGVVI